jgi:hypothetical protein
MSTVTIYTVTGKARCWKCFDCLACGAVYRYKFEADVQGSGGTPDIATKVMNSEAAKAVEDGVETRPCPECGFVQPHMTGHWKFKWHMIVGLSAAMFAGTIALVAIGDTGARPQLPLLLGVAAGLAFLCHLAVAWRNPNRDLAANRRSGGRDKEDGTVQVLREGVLDEGGPPTRVLGKWQLFFLFLALLAAPIAFHPIGAAAVNGWVPNPDVNPSLIAPGDKVQVTFPDGFDAVSGLWSGTPKVTVENPQDFGGRPPEVKVATRTGDWTGTISEGSGNQRTTAFADVSLPADDRLVGKTLRLNVSVSVKYPNQTGAKSFSNRAVNVNRTVNLVVGPPGAREEVRRVTQATAAASAGLVLASGLGLAALGRALRRRSPGALNQPFEEGASARGFGTSRASMFR